MRLGIMSFAHLHAEAYITNLRTLPGVEVIGLADDNLDRGRYYAAQYQARLFDSYADLLAEKPDGVVISSENSRHRALAEMAAGAGVHILCEKPLATTVNDARHMVEVCKRAGVVLMTAFPMRFNAPALEIKRLIESGKLGQIYGCNTTNQGRLPVGVPQPGVPSFLTHDWFVDKELAGGGSVADHTVHLADLLRWYLGSEVTEVYAVTNQILHADRVHVETGGLILLTFASGAFASIDCSWSKPPVYPIWGGLKMDIIGEKGLATMDAFKQVISVYSQHAGRPSWVSWGSDSDRAMLSEFIAAIREQRTPAVTGEDGLRGVEIVAAAYRSAESGQVERIEHSV